MCGAEYRKIEHGTPFALRVKKRAPLLSPSIVQASRMVPTQYFQVKPKGHRHISKLVDIKVDSSSKVGTTIV